MIRILKTPAFWAAYTATLILVVGIVFVSMAVGLPGTADGLMEAFLASLLIYWVVTVCLESMGMVTPKQDFVVNLIANLIAIVAAIVTAVLLSNWLLTFLNV